MRQRISGAMMWLRSKAAFFGVLAMHADHVEDPTVPTAATDGRTIYYNPTYVASLTGPQLIGLVLHEVLHCAFRHVPRRGFRDPLRWNIAADYVVNSMVPEVEGAVLPEGLLQSDRYYGRSVEEVYDMLPKGHSKTGFSEEWKDVMPLPETAKGGGAAGGDETYWRNAIRGAVQAHKTDKSQGRLPRGLQLLVDEVEQSQVSWRELLRDHTVHHPFDFGEFDPRLVGRGIYEEQLEGEKLDLSVCLDTSGSCLGWIPTFMGELRALLEAFPHVSASLYYADAQVHGPFEVQRFEEVPRPLGGGGTDFRPFFSLVGEGALMHGNQVLVYLTDGYGSFPADPPWQETVWVVTPGGLRDEDFPFGHPVRLSSE